MSKGMVLGSASGTTWADQHQRAVDVQRTPVTFRCLLDFAHSDFSLQFPPPTASIEPAAVKRGSAAVHISGQDVLIVVDVQHDFTRGSMAIPGAAAIIEPINRLAARFPNLVVVTDWHPPGHISFASAHAGLQPGDKVAAGYGVQAVFADHCIQGSWGAELDADLQVGMAQLILRKGFRLSVDSYGCFYENDCAATTGLAAYLQARGIQRVFCAGLARFGCVMHSALGAARDGFHVFMVDDASAGRRNPTDDAAQESLAAVGVGWVHSRELIAG